MTAWIAVLVQLLPLVAAIYREYLSASAQAKAKQEQFKLDQAAFLVLVQTTVQKMQASQAALSQGAGNAWDASDKPPQ